MTGMKTVSVVIAYRDMSDAHRRASFEFVHAWYARLGWEIVVSFGDGQFSRAQAINAGVRRASGDIIVQSDPDSIVALEQVAHAVELAGEADGLVIGHNRYLYLTQECTARVLDGRFPWLSATPSDCDESGEGGLGNVVAFSRSTWEQAGGFDERFGVWGGDDGAFAYACEAFCGPTRRVWGDMVHLWHPRLPQSVPGHPGYQEQWAIVAEYLAAREIGPEAVRDLVKARPAPSDTGASK